MYAGPMFPRTRSLWFGFTLPLKALKLIISNPVLIFWSGLPIIVTLAVYGFVIARAQGYAQAALSHYIVAWGLSPDGWVSSAIMLGASLILLLVGALTFSLVATVVASPFNDFLAERTEALATPPMPPTRGLSLKGKIRLIWVDVLKSVCASAAALCAILVSWIPLLNLIAMELAFLLITFQFISYPQTRRGEGIRDGLRFLWRHIYSCSAFGAVVSVLFAIPVVSSLALPLAVVGGTLLVARARGEGGRGLR